MNDNESHLLRNYQELMSPQERMVARWLTEEWDGQTQEIPKWLRNRVRQSFSMRDFGVPKAMARTICLKLLENHKDQIKLQSKVQKNT